MKYCVLIKLSKNDISFWYQAEGTGNQILPLDNDAPIKPLTFCIKGNDIHIGEYAKQLAVNGDSNAYIDYFRIIKNPTQTFAFAGEPRPIKQLLYFGIERYLNDFFNQTLFGKEGTLEDNKSKIPLCFIFADDIEINEKNFVTSLLTDAGYANISTICYHNFLETALNKQNIITSADEPMLLTSIDGDIYVKNLKKNTADGCLKVLKGLGNDPQCKVLADEIYNRAYQCNQFIDKEIEYPNLINEARESLQTEDPIFMGRVRWADGNEYEYSIYRSDIAIQLQHSTIGDRLVSALKEVIKNCKISTANASILLNGSGINTNYFSEKLLQEFPKVKGISDEIHEAAMELIVQDIIQKDYVLPLRRRNYQRRALLQHRRALHQLPLYQPRRPLPHLHRPNVPQCQRLPRQQKYRCRLLLLLNE